MDDSPDPQKPVRPANRAVWPRSEEELGPFRRVFERNELNVPGYLKLLNQFHPVAVRQVREGVASLRAAEYISRYLAERNWRPNLVAAVAVLLLPDPARLSTELWATFDHPSWAAAQLAVTMKCADPDFTAQARRRIDGYLASSDPLVRDSKCFKSLVWALSATDSGWLAERCPPSCLANFRSADRQEGKRASGTAPLWGDILRDLSVLAEIRAHG